MNNKQPLIKLEALDEMTFRDMTNRATTTGLGKQNDVAVLWPAGSGGRLPKGALMLTLQVEGEESNKVGIPFWPQLEIETDEGGMFCGNTVSGVIMNFLPGGNVILTLGGNNFLVEGDVTITGDVRIDGDLTVGGDVTTDAGVSLNTHVHSGVVIGGDDTGEPVT